MLACCAARLAACTGTIGDLHDRDDSALPPPTGLTDANPLESPAAFGRSGVRRLSRDELRLTVRDLLGVDVTAALDSLPPDDGDVFDNEYEYQRGSAALVQGLGVYATHAAEAVLADEARLTALVPCEPRSPVDSDCLREFVASIGPRALRRPMAEEEIDELVALMPPDSTTFGESVGLVVRALLQHPEFLHRVEIGEPVAGSDGLRALGSYEIATRMSFFLWGSMPDHVLTQHAAEDRLRDADERAALAVRMLDDPRAADRVARFHALWLGYGWLPHAPELADAMRRESDALVRRIFDDHLAWTTLFTFDETFVEPSLAMHYGFAPIAEPSWVSLPEGRRGLLSHGSFLAHGAKFGDTSPTARGLVVRERLLCDPVPPPPPPDPSRPPVVTDEPPGEPCDCKPQRYAVHATGACAGCHQRTDPIGFGLEAYDDLGRFRTHESPPETCPDRPADACPIEGRGELVGVGTFAGPGELGSLVAQTDELATCMVRRLFHYAMGRADTPSDRPVVDALRGRFESSGEDLRELLVAFVAAEPFAYRVEEEP